MNARCALLRRALLLCAAAYIVVPGTVVAKQDESLVEAGQNIAQENCARCHAIGRLGDSPRDEAPPFRRLHERYEVDDLAEAFAEGIVVGHTDMPPFAFDQEQIEALLAYLKSLESDAQN